eukprot:XP_027308667.1 zinc finger protein 282-like [Anas platyrhynchos]
MARWGPAQEPEWGPEPWQPVPPQPPGHVAVPVAVPVAVEGEKQPGVAEISLWTVVAAVQAVERKVETQALRLLSLEGSPQRVRMTPPACRSRSGAAWTAGSRSCTGWR